jgi:hypothetical protein
MADPAEEATAVEPGLDAGSGPPRTYSPNAVHMLRTFQMSTLVLSQMADQKASMLMGAGVVVFSLAVGQALTGAAPWPLILLAVFAFLSALTAAIAVAPSIGKPKPGGALNRLFFGHIHDLDEEEWTRDMLSRLEADERVFRLMLRDAWQNGQVLRRRKYRYLVWAYRIFIAGLVTTLVAFAAQLALG